MDDGTVYHPVYPSKEAVEKRKAQDREAGGGETAGIHRVTAENMGLVGAASAPANVVKSFSGNGSVVWRDQGSESFNFRLAFSSGAPAGLKDATLGCADYSAAAPEEGMLCSYTATLQSWDESTGTATYDIYATPPGATDGVTSNERGLIGYQHLQGKASVKYPTKGYLELQKVSGNPAMTENNACYSLQGAQYGVYTDAACTKIASGTNADDGKAFAGILTTDAEGNSRKVQLAARTYYVKEKNASKGYRLDPAVHKVTVTSEGTAKVKSEEIPMNDPTVIEINKASAEGTAVPEVRSLEGTQFKITYYAGYYTKENLPKETRHWVIQAKKRSGGKYRAGLLPEYLVEGSEFYYGRDNVTTVIPLGTITIEEVKAAEGYNLDNKWLNKDAAGTGVFLTQIRDAGGQAKMHYGDTVIEENGFTAEDRPIYGGVRIQKQDAELKSAEPMGNAELSGIRFDIINRSEEPIRVGDKEYAKDQVVMTITTDQDGMAQTEVDTLPYGTYEIKEKEANEFYLCSEQEGRTFRITEHGKMVTADANGKSLVFDDQIKRNDLSFRKVEEGTDKAMGMIPFVLENKDTHEKHVIVVDKNGRWSSSKYAHSLNTNAMDGLLERYHGDEEIPTSELAFKFGTWFGTGRSGSMAPVNDQLCVFPYGEYSLTELRCEANKGYKLIENYEVTIDEDTSETNGQAIDLYKLHNTPEKREKPTVTATVSPTPLQAKTDSVSAPKTGDPNHIAGLLVILALATAMCSSLVWLKRKVGKR